MNHPTTTPITIPTARRTGNRRDNRRGVCHAAHGFVFLSRRKSGIAGLYALLSLSICIGFCSFGVEWGRMQLVKTECLRAGDAAVRYGASGLINDAAAARANAIAAAVQNTVNGTPVTLLTSDISFGSWDSSSKTFTVAAAGSEDSATAIRVQVVRSAARGNAVQFFFASILGRKSCDVTTTSIAVVTPGTTITETVAATSNPWLAGDAAGTIADPVNPHNDPDYAGTASTPKESPTQFTGLTFKAGQALTFDNVNGGAAYDPSLGLSSPDGDTNYTTDFIAGNENGKSNVIAPINAVIAVFLPKNAVTDNTTYPPELDFSTQADRNFTSLSPQLNQVFFIGDGRADDGTVQQFIVPTGAKRLFIGTMDWYEWSNNIGSYSVTMHSTPTITLVH